MGLLYLFIHTHTVKSQSTVSEGTVESKNKYRKMTVVGKALNMLDTQEKESANFAFCT
jgi:hypothetical protein